MRIKLNIIDNFSCRFLIYFFTEYLTIISEKKMIKNKSHTWPPPLLHAAALTLYTSR